MIPQKQSHSKPANDGPASVSSIAWGATVQPTPRHLPHPHIVDATTVPEPRAEGEAQGRIKRVSGPVVHATGVHADMFNIVHVGHERLLGEVIQISGERITIQVYEDTTGLRPGDPVVGTGAPLSVLLGPGMLGGIYDGIERPLPALVAQNGPFLGRGIEASGLDVNKPWEFVASAKIGDQAGPGTVIGTVQEGRFVHRILIPPTMKGRIASIASGTYTIKDAIATLEGGEQVFLAHHWPVRVPRPTAKRLPPEIPLITGQRIIDCLFPIAKGGSAAIPGPFGAGKTVNQQQLAKWCDADVIVYVGCGERGNEMTEILTEFPHLQDPKTHGPLMDRTVLIANTSNMPVAAREASIYTGVTIAEYFRDMGYDVALMADSTSRWAEAMREISSRLEEMPGEEGYPAYLASRLSEFYERAGRVRALGSPANRAIKGNSDTSAERIGSVSLIGAVSPAGGDFSEPVTQATLRVTKAFWALDAKLSQRRHFPSINWLSSYSLYHDALDEWFAQNAGQDWRELISELQSTLGEEERLLEIVQLVGSDALPEREQLALEVARIIREGFLQQNAFHEQDSYSSIKKSYLLMKAIVEYKRLSAHALASGASLSQILSLPARTKLISVKYELEAEAMLAGIISEIESGLSAMFKGTKDKSVTQATQTAQAKAAAAASAAERITTKKEQPKADERPTSKAQPIPSSRPPPHKDKEKRAKEHDKQKGDKKQRDAR